MKTFQKIAMALVAISGWGFTAPAHAESYTIGVSEENCTVILTPQKESYDEGETVAVTLILYPEAVFGTFNVYYECTESEYWETVSARVKPHGWAAPLRRASSFDYRLEIWNLDGHWDEPVVAAEGESYTFTMPARNVEIEAVCFDGRTTNTVTVVQTAHGTTAVDLPKAKPGQTVVITATADAGYVANEVQAFARETIGGAIYESLLDVARVDASHFTFVMPPGPVKVQVSYIKYLRGDVNRDGQISIIDITALVNIILGYDNDSTSMYDLIAADVNEDGLISVTDATELVNIILGN